ncbi:unnamed protein product [Thlaspi arvense]|uniref:Choline transporter-like protein n=1 Tax=Thlaspi arvense TaxID=13288 RepID=A0AAU9T084_THLAR|nr:unnamed protein product [Thlaspi arvense]
MYVANWHRIELTIQIIGVASHALSQNLKLFVVLPLLTLGLVVYYAPIVVFLVFARFNGKFVPRELDGEYFCEWKEDSWVPAYYALAIITMLWSLAVMVEMQVYVISGAIAQWYFSNEDSLPKKCIRSSLRNAFGQSFGTICLSGILISVVRVVRAIVDNAREENPQGIVNLALRCCANALLGAVDYLNKFTINFAAITGEAYCTSAKMSYELLRRNLLSAVFVETVSTRILTGIVFVLSAAYAVATWAVLRGVSNLGIDSYLVAILAWLLLIVMLAFFVHVLDNVIDTIYVCYAIDRDKGDVCKQEVHEATMICIDNSEWMRNGDYSPSRLQAQTEAVNLLCGAKTQSNPENTVGVLTMAGKGVRVLTTPTSDLGKILACMHGLDVGGEINLTAAIQIAQLALKHRQNKNQRQRIILSDVGLVLLLFSPIKYEKKALELVGKRLKKNSVSLDIVNFGEDDDEEKPQKLEALLTAVNNNDGSHIVHVPSGANALSDVLLSSTISQVDKGIAYPNIDPELALALRVSMEEERARQEAAAKKAADEAGQKDKDGDTASGSQETAARTTEKSAEPMDEDNALLDQAIAMSVSDVNMSEAADEDQDLALALQMSMSGEESSEATGAGNLLGDQAFISSVLSSLPGVDPNDPAVKALLASLPDESKRNEEDESSSKGEDEKK